MIPRNFKMQALIQRCDTEREEMHLIEEYRADENSQPELRTETNNEPQTRGSFLAPETLPGKRERTVRLVKSSVDQLQSDGQTVTIEAICCTRIECDLEHRGVKKSALQENLEAHASYRLQSKSYQVAQARKRKGKSALVKALSVCIDPHRAVDRARSRYLQMTKSEIVERLLAVEQASADLAEQQANLQFMWAEREYQAEAWEPKKTRRQP